MKKVMTGIDIGLIDSLKEAMEKSISIELNVSFLMESGVRSQSYIASLVRAANRGVKIKH